MTADTIQNTATLEWYERLYGPFVHMSQEEKAIWIRWLQQGGSQFAPFIYDLRVGDGLKMPIGSSSFAINAAYALTTKRIDALYIQGNMTVIVEVKRRAGLSAVGQLIGYRDLISKTPGVTSQLEMLLVTDTLQPDMQTILRENAIHWNEVGQ